MVEERKDHLWKIAQEAEERIDELVKTGASPMGLDVGTAKVVVSRRKGKEIESGAELNAFIPVPYSKFTETILGQNDIAYYREGEELVIYGSATERFANMFNAECRRPMADGLLNPREKRAMPVLEAILTNMVPKPKTAGETLAFSVPAAIRGREAALTYHEATLRGFFQSQGYKPVAINEGLAVIFSELEDNNFTGIGISCGGGMCNVTLAFLSIPSILLGIGKGGDYIDSAVGAVINEHATRVKSIKEEGVDLSRQPKDKFERALRIYYEELIETLVEGLSKEFSTEDKLPRTDRAIPIVLSGGASKPRGFKDMFEKALRSRTLPIEISEVRVAKDPLTATARGALIAAMYEK
jgi:actin-like ATPase involved in cell morphogenesis